LITVNESERQQLIQIKAERCKMSKFQVGDTVTFRREVVGKCGHTPALAEYRGTVTAISGAWVFLAEKCGRAKVMPVTSMCKVARSGAVLELV
jgi:ribosomal protein L19